MLVLNRPSKAQVLSELQICNVIHFAYYDMSDASDPSNSCLLLYNREHNKIDRLTIRDLTSVSLRKAQITYLSACFTANNPARHLVDEIIHLASGFQLTGFSHDKDSSRRISLACTIGSTWVFGRCSFIFDYQLHMFECLRWVPCMLRTNASRSLHNKRSQG